MKDENTLDPAYIKEQLRRARTILNDLIGEHEMYTHFFSGRNEEGELSKFADSHTFAISMGNAYGWLQQAEIDLYKFLDQHESN